MPLYTSAFRVAAAPLSGLVIPIATFAWPTGTKRYTTNPNAEAAIPVEPRLLAADGISFAGGLRPGGITLSDPSVVLANHDGAITRILEDGPEPRRTEVLLQWAAPGLDVADWHTHLECLYDREEYQDETRSVRLFLRPQDGPLQSPAPKAQLLESEAPRALPQGFGTYLPLVYGVHDSQALTGLGMVPAINWGYYAPTSEWRWVVALGYVTVNRVYLNGALQVVSTDYNVTYPIVGGKLFTSIDFTSAPGEDAVVAADVDGYETVGDGSGDLILNPVEQIQHFAVNFGFGDNRGGAWNDPADYPVDADSLAISAADAAAFTFEGSLYLGGTPETSTFKDVLEQKWLTSWPRYRAYWKEGAGTLAIRPLDHRHYGYTSPGPTVSSSDDAPFFRGRKHAFGFAPSRDTSRLVRRVDMTHLPGAFDKKLWSSFVVEDLSQVEQTGETFALECSAARIL